MIVYGHGNPKGTTRWVPNGGSMSLKRLRYWPSTEPPLAWRGLFFSQGEARKLNYIPEWETPHWLSIESSTPKQNHAFRLRKHGKRLGSI